MMDLGPLNNSKTPPPPPIVTDDPGWTSSEKEYRRVLLNRVSRNGPPRPHQNPGNTSTPRYRERGTDHGGTDPFTFPEWLLRLIDWLNEKVGTGKQKSKDTGNQMDSLKDLFYQDEELCNDCNMAFIQGEALTEQYCAKGQRFCVYFNYEGE